jgi:hypothetical protein
MAGTNASSNTCEHCRARPVFLSVPLLVAKLTEYEQWSGQIQRKSETYQLLETAKVRLCLHCVRVRQKGAFALLFCLLASFIAIPIVLDINGVTFWPGAFTVVAFLAALCGSGYLIIVLLGVTNTTFAERLAKTVLRRAASSLVIRTIWDERHLFTGREWNSMQIRKARSAQWAAAVLMACEILAALLLVGILSSLGLSTWH